MRLRARTLMPSTRAARRGVLLGASLGVIGLAALPVAAELDETASAPDGVAGLMAVHEITDLLPAEGAAGNPGLERWYSPAEAERLSPDVETVRVTIADAEEPTAAVEPVSAEPEPEPAEPQEPAPTERNRWDRLAECESGEWVNGGESFIEGSARWDYGINFVHEGYEQFQGGLNFHPGTWDAYRDPDMPDHAGNATREQEIIVGERVLADQGWQAWPRCSKMVGLR